MIDDKVIENKLPFLPNESLLHLIRANQLLIQELGEEVVNLHKYNSEQQKQIDFLKKQIVVLSEKLNGNH